MFGRCFFLTKLHLQIQFNYWSNKIEDLVFIGTALSCAMIAFVTWCFRKTNNTEEPSFEEKIAEAIETYVEQKLHRFKLELVEDQIKKEDHMVNCILYRSVNITEQIKSVNVRTYVQITYNDIHVFDWNGEKISIEIENIPLAFNSQMAANPMEMNIEFEVSGNFKYIEFTGLKIPNPNGAKTWQSSGNVTFLTCDKTIVCTTFISEKKNKIYNTAFLWYVYLSSFS